MEVGLVDVARARVREALREDAAHWSWSYASVELGETPPTKAGAVFVALARGEWATLLNARSSPVVDAEADAVLRAIALDGLGRHDEAVAAVEGRFEGRLMAGHPLQYVLQSVAMWLRRAPGPGSSLGWFCALSEGHALRFWAERKAPAAKCASDASVTTWKSPLW